MRFFREKIPLFGLLLMVSLSGCGDQYDVEPDQQSADFAEGFFLASNGVDGRELWRSDGTVSGTYMVRDINTGSSSSI